MLDPLVSAPGVKLSNENHGNHAVPGAPSVVGAAVFQPLKENHEGHEPDAVPGVPLDCGAPVFQSLNENVGSHEAEGVPAVSGQSTVPVTPLLPASKATSAAMTT